jgi:hypothetical protein
MLRQLGSSNLFYAFTFTLLISAYYPSNIGVKTCDLYDACCYETYETSLFVLVGMHVFWSHDTGGPRTIISRSYCNLNVNDILSDAPAPSRAKFERNFFLC